MSEKEHCKCGDVGCPSLSDENIIKSLRTTNAELLKREAAIALALKDVREVLLGLAPHEMIDNLCDGNPEPPCFCRQRMEPGKHWSMCELANKALSRTTDPTALIEAHDKKLLERVSELENIVSRISQVACGKDKFPGDLVQYVQNEIDGRNGAGKDMDAIHAVADKLCDECHGLLNDALEYCRPKSTQRSGGK